MGAAAVIILRKERDIVDTYRGAGSTSADRARRPDELGVDQGLVFNRLVRRAVLREVDNGRFYLDEPSWEGVRYVRRQLASIVVIIAVAVLIALAVIMFTARSG